MKIDHFDLKSLYRDCVSEVSSPSRENCPSPEIMLKHFRSDISRRERAEVIDHAARCGYCHQEIKFILKALDDEKELNEGIAKALDSGEKEYGDKTRVRRMLVSRPFLKYGFAFMATVLAVSMIFVYILKRPEKAFVERGTEARINLVEPVNKAIVLEELVFKWEKISNSDHYLIEVFDKELRFLWRSEKAQASELFAPLELKKLLKKGQRYFWMVTAVLQSGYKIESRLEEFVIKK